MLGTGEFAFAGYQPNIGSNGRALVEKVDSIDAGSRMFLPIR